MKTTLVLLLFFSFFHVGDCQPQPITSEIGEWKLVEDSDSRWEFKTDGKVYAHYEGENYLNIYAYEMSDSKPFCPGMEIGEKTNITYLKMVDQEDGFINCYYIFGLNEQRLTLINAATGTILAFIRVE